MNPSYGLIQSNTFSMSLCFTARHKHTQWNEQYTFYKDYFYCKKPIFRGICGLGYLKKKQHITKTCLTFVPKGMFHICF